jgi:acetyltransferase-like isoleucine patch superfamily enzyme
MVLHGWWPSFLKVWFYRLKGYRIGRHVHIGLGSVIIGRDVELGAHARIGFGSFVRGRTIRIGAHVQIGSATMLDTPHLEIGEGTKINEQVFAGGLQFPDSKLIVGRNCQIMQMTFINPTRTITIGDDTGIGGDCLLFGHTSWLSRFEGYPVEFDSIEIGKSVSIAWRVFVLPGTRIGDGAVVGANSLARGRIPGRCLAVGFPAQVVSREPAFPKPVAPDDARRFLLEMVAELMEFLRAEGYECRQQGSCWRVTGKGPGGWLRRRRQTWRLWVRTEPESRDPVNADRGDVFLSLARISVAMRTQLDRQQVMWLDIETKERSDHGVLLGEEAAQHLRRYGVRFLRVPSSGGG